MRAQDFEHPRPAHRPACPVREAYEMRFRLTRWARQDHRLTDEMLVQLSRCKSDEARRLILGVSK